MKLDSGYRCETCATKNALTLWRTVSPSGATVTDKILCLPDAVDLEERGWKVDSLGITN